MSNKEVTRCISLDEDFMNYKNGSDILYGFMINRATYNVDEEILYLTKSKFTRIKPALKMLFGSLGRSFITDNLNKLKKAGFLEEGFTKTAQNPKTPCYIFPNQSYKRYKMVNNDLLLYLVCTRNNLAVRIYTYLLDKYEWKKREQDYYDFTIKELKQACGYAATTKTCDELIKLNLLSLKREGIIDYEEDYLVNEDNVTYPTKALTFVAASCDKMRGPNTSELEKIVSGIYANDFNDEVL